VLRVIRHEVRKPAVWMGQLDVEENSLPAAATQPEQPIGKL
jgi:hypothetical protein